MIASLLDISPIVGTVTIRDKDIPVPGITAEGVIYLLQRFPVLQAVLMKKELADLTTEALIAMAPEAIDSIIAVGLGHIASPEAENAAGNLALDEKMYVLEKIMEVTLPRGIGPFKEMLDRVASKAVAPGWEQATKSVKQSSS